MALHLSARKQRTILAVGLLVVVTVWLYSAYIIRPLMREAGELAQQVRSAREQLKSLESATANEAALREQHRQLQGTVASLRSLLPAEEELPRVIGLLSDLASQAQVKIQSILPQRPIGSQESARGPTGTTAKPVMTREVLIQIDALAGYHQLGTFLSLVESSDRPLQVSSLRISGDPREPKRLHVKLLIQSYFAASGAMSFGESPMARAPSQW